MHERRRSNYKGGFAHSAESGALGVFWTCNNSICLEDSRCLNDLTLCYNNIAFLKNISLLSWEALLKWLFAEGEKVVIVWTGGASKIGKTGVGGTCL